MTVIGWDSDGVLYRFTKAYHSWMNQYRGMSLDVEVEAHTWNWFEEWQTVEDFKVCMDAGVDAGFLFWEGELYDPDIGLYIKQLKAAGHENHLITYRFSGNLQCSQEATKYFYEEALGIEFDSIVFSRDKTCLPTDVFLEDNLNNYDALDESGTKAYLINRPYNQVEGDSRRRVDSIKEFVDLVM